MDDKEKPTEVEKEAPPPPTPPPPAEPPMREPGKKLAEGFPTPPVVPLPPKKDSN